MGDYMIKLLFQSLGGADVTIMIAIRSWRNITRTARFEILHAFIGSTKHCKRTTRDYNKNCKGLRGPQGTTASILGQTTTGVKGI